MAAKVKWRKTCTSHGIRKWVKLLTAWAKHQKEECYHEELDLQEQQLKLETRQSLHLRGYMGVEALLQPITWQLAGGSRLT